MKSTLHILMLLVIAAPFAHAEKSCDEIKSHLKSGDIVFTAIDSFLFKRVAEATLSWTSHVGMAIYDQHEKRWVVYESKVPLSTKTEFCDFIGRTIPGQLAIRRLPRLSETDVVKLTAAAERRMGILYHQGFDYNSSRQFCSKFVHDVYGELGREEIGKLETFGDVLKAGKSALSAKEFESVRDFFNLWFFPLGGPPLDRVTITPQSLLVDSDLVTVEF